MTDSGVIDLPLPDRTARERIASELDTNLLVEAGAGSGKTTALVRRMIMLISSGAATVDQIAAVTFTRKAAGELRERFQTGIEARIRGERGVAAPDPIVLERLGTALDEIDRAFIGTIHSFCGRLLRERPLEVGLDPGFQELPVEERAGLRRRFWESYLERLSRDSDPLLEELATAGLRAPKLLGLFEHLVENPDVDFPAEHATPPSMSDVGEVRAELEDIVSRGRELMGDMPLPGREWDSLQKKIRKLHFERDITGWEQPFDLFEAISTLCKPGPNGHKTTYKAWRDRDMAKALTAQINTFGVGPTPANRLVDQWFAHRYALAIRLGKHAADEFAAHRLRMGVLDFQDLLVLAARLLRSNPSVRRQLGSRYRRLLVDEFQDTDPLQAEIMLLLSSDPTNGDEDDEIGAEAVSVGGEADWRVAVPRPGALFVVGDPKQSIYRFRRADIQLYGFVKGRFSTFGEVVALSTNFRSRPQIGDLVNAVFSQPGFFPEKATTEQAAFERLDTRPPTESVPREGVFAYEIGPEGTKKGVASADDGARLASWIRDRIESGERTAGDFLILTRGRGQLAAYARALEARSLPVQVTGAGIGVEVELRELEALLECMIDPTNPVRVVSALVGLFFGVDYDRLVTHRLEGGGLDAMRPGSRGHADVLEAIRTLHGWWRASIREPADIFIGRLVTELGLLPYAASGELGSLRAGALLYALDAVRGAALGGDASLPGALAALGAALELKEAEAPFEPGRLDAIRLMNLHQAKGLEGTVVILADPTESKLHRPELHMSRSPEGVAEGYLRVTASDRGWRPAQDLARPMGWSQREAAERGFDEAEEVRLLYVAATRAREELVVARWTGGRGTSAWAPFDSWLDEHAERLSLEPREPPPPDEVHAMPGEVSSSVSAADATLKSLGAPTYRRVTVTDVAKHDAPTPGSRGEGAPPDGLGPLRGFSWGSAVHGALAFAATGAGDEAMRSACRDLLVEHQRPLDDHGQPVELRELVDLVSSVRASTLWARAHAAERMLVEISFSVPGDPPDPRPRDEPRPGQVAIKGRRQLDLFGLGQGDAPVRPAAGEADVTSDADEGDLPGTIVLEGVVDLAFREQDGWVIADYKTDVGTDPDFSSRSESYRRQVDLYADAWARLTGEPVKERVLFYTAQGRIESW